MVKGNEINVSTRFARDRISKQQHESKELRSGTERGVSKQNVGKAAVKKPSGLKSKK